ncbi:MAG: universal stress protein [Pyrinomonadaceae bacterium]|jgi:nucleotide-binding universal stress UspA family protein|nr:universal stress protein [Pyrinomonadaceae bacterium]
MKVLLATDGSEYSEAAAIKTCEMFGRLSDTEIKVVSVYEPFQPIASEPFAVSAEYYREMTNASKNNAVHYIEATEGLIRDRCPDANISTALLEGKPSARIVEFAEEWGANAIVVGSHGRGFWGRLLGSVSNAVVNHAPCSVLVVRKPTD